jgi:FkbM family methyltransferase
MFYGQHKQDEFLEKNIFKGFKNGFFVDIGAHDGVSINNTLYFEKGNNWTGINFEPIPEIYNRLIVNRPKCKNYNYAISEKEGISKFIHAVGYPEMISGLSDHYDQRHHNRLQFEMGHYGGKKEILNVETRRLDTIFEENNISHIHFMSIDVEGAEFSVIKSINFDKVFIDVILFENNYEDTSIPIIVYLISKGYYIFRKNQDIYMIHKDSQFEKNVNNSK